jgi:hypothetical protein
MVAVTKEASCVRENVGVSIAGAVGSTGTGWDLLNCCVPNDAPVIAEAQRRRQKAD